MAYCKLTQEIQDKLVECIEAGLYYDIACDAVGISRVTFWYWMKKGKQQKSDQFVNFFNAIKKAKGKCAKNAIDMINQHRLKEWTAAAWLLERRFRQYYGKDAKEYKDVVKLVKLLSKGNADNGEINNEETKQDSEV